MKTIELNIDVSFYAYALAKQYTVKCMRPIFIHVHFDNRKDLLLKHKKILNI